MTNEPLSRFALDRNLERALTFFVLAVSLSPWLKYPGVFWLALTAIEIVYVFALLQLVLYFMNKR